jgi:hypothetical protein
VLAALVALLIVTRGGGVERAPAVVVPVPGAPVGLATTPDRVWVAAQRSGEVWTLDAAGRPVGAPLRTGGTPARIAVGASGVWVADTADGAVIPVQWRPQRRVFDRIAVGADVADIALAARAVWVASSAEGIVRVLEPGAGSAAHELRVGANPVALAADERWVAVAVAGSGTLVRIDARTRRPVGAPLRIAGVPVDVALADGVAWVASARGTVAGVDLARGALTGPAIAVGGRPLAVAADGADIYVLTRDEVVHVEGGEVRARRRISGEPAAVALDARHVWIADAAGDRVVGLERE